DALGAMAGAVVLAGEPGRRGQGDFWGTYQEQNVQVGCEVVERLAAHSAPTALSTGLPGIAEAAAPGGGLLSAPLYWLPPALGVLVLFCPVQPRLTLETALVFLDLTGTYLGLYVQTTGLQERLKAFPEPGEAANVSLPLHYDPDRIIGHSPGIKAIMQEIQQA